MNDISFNALIIFSFVFNWNEFKLEFEDAMNDILMMNWSSSSFNVWEFSLNRIDDSLIDLNSRIMIVIQISISLIYFMTWIILLTIISIFIESL